MLDFIKDNRSLLSKREQGAFAWGKQNGWEMNTVKSRLIVAIVVSAVRESKEGSCGLDSTEKNVIPVQTLMTDNIEQTIRFQNLPWKIVPNINGSSTLNNA
jgi:hypothetical protein